MMAVFVPNNYMESIDDMRNMFNFHTLATRDISDTYVT